MNTRITNLNTQTFARENKDLILYAIDHASFVDYNSIQNLYMIDGNLVVRFPYDMPSRYIVHVKKENYSVIYDDASGRAELLQKLQQRRKYLELYYDQEKSNRTLNRMLWEHVNQHCK